MKLLEFEKSLRQKLKSYEKPRPLICEGNPLECEIFIVGINSATEMQNDFWSFWSPENGFNKAQWLESYILERKLKPLKPNKTRRNKLSNTRQRIEWIVEKTKPFKTLETNLFVKATPTADELLSEDRESSVFEFLLDTIKPKIIFIHGNEVIEYFEKLYDLKITKNEVSKFEILGTKTNILAMNHLSRGWSKQKSLELGEFLKSKVIN
ncbi:hypothetical protein [Aestuariibaculum sediminum]|uniref:Uracil-DNA glycosylase-like domain-containing protein n=1 Tax=Aestuariibaculum sediminum TaxID=2770637 RepID=A0A8J6Q9F0_9FLAO|nr:hypothetical protein [Aestuariibaculum sediminum]MBD0833555.1 hypothetical protein [Aestuariibaculum sediminum]